MRIALAGNPNSGKTTMFNALTGRNEKVGNWAGVTVEKKNILLKRITLEKWKNWLQLTFRVHIQCHLSHRKKVSQALTLEMNIQMPLLILWMQLI